MIIEDKRILITGGTGSLGKHLAKKLIASRCDVIIYSRDEGKQALLFGDEVTKVIGDVRDYEKLKSIFLFHKPDYVIHAAALKRIDDMELYPDECIKTNIVGSENVAKASLRAGVEKCILISTDKACQPINVYGSTKFIAERVFANFDYNSDSTIFSSVRYGNVIASRGSFIPLWLDLLSKGERIKVTSIDCTRFLFTLDDAVDVVLSSLYLSQGGEVFIPNIDSFKMEDVIKAIGIIHGSDLIEYDIIGMRPGEKFHEDMLCKTELMFTMQPSGKLLCVLPQNTRKKHTYAEKYSGLELNSSLHINDNIGQLVNLIEKGLNVAN